MWVIYFGFVFLSTNLVQAISFKIDVGIQTDNQTGNQANESDFDARRFIMNVPQIVNDMIEKVKQFSLLQAQELLSNQSNKHVRSKHSDSEGESGRHRDRQRHRSKRTKQKQEIDLREMFIDPQQVRNDSEITDFTKHIYKQAMKIFDNLKDRAENPATIDEIDNIARSYDEKFGEFVKKTQHHNIKTRLGRQKVIINTLDTSNRIVKRLVNFLVGRMGRTLSLRNRISMTDYQDEIKKKMDIENQHVCKKFNICRSGSGFSAFLIDVLKIITSNDRQMKIMTDALTEALKYAHFRKIMDSVTARGFKKSVIKFESYDPVVIKAVFNILQNIIMNKDKPIEVFGAVDKRVNKTVAFLEIIEAFEKALPPNERNVLEWDDILISMRDWRDEKRSDITEIMQIFVDHIRKGTERFDRETAKNVEHNIVIILDYPYDER